MPDDRKVPLDDAIEQTISRYLTMFPQDAKIAALAAPIEAASIRIQHLDLASS